MDKDSDDERERGGINPEAKIISKEFGMDVVMHINRLATAENDACSVCGSRDNNVQGAELFLSVSPQIAGRPSPQFMPLLSTVCNNCGYVRLFSRLTVERLIQAWKEDQGAVETLPPLADGGGNGG